MQPKSQSQIPVPRREFLRLTGGGTGLAAIAVSAPVVARGLQGDETADDKRGGLYRETEHVKTFYRVNRY